jgi:hypothetical protein
MHLAKVLMLLDDGQYVRIYNKMSGKFYPFVFHLGKLQHYLNTYQLITGDKRMLVNRVVPLYHAEELYIVTL